ncbi:uncharacterized protein BCR38DRAFT_349350 [Pseudomassariella vexata]|uniref:5-Methylcytosine G/T mismatch-specific DNA glycosylase n=1 Tax=Pseudomassariella vexata TaxID=1141098 RepID=A0A1Y2DN15_9PEZI|nr:uncharacterized protein BCR38DRAFT_349350 [Pseudomassariella vexata]ORY60637.1 hypothetical protein BCR38DRAFT_349350 [Pseudomassariella vexata]
MGLPKDKERDVDITSSVVASASDEVRPRERRPRSKSERVKGDRDHDRDHDRERDRDRERERDGLRPHKSKSTRSKPVDGDADSHSSTSRRRHRTKEEKEQRHREREREREQAREKKTSSMSDLVPELSRTTSSRVSLPYPSFSKAHSKESVTISREDISSTSAAQRADPWTPETTDLSSRADKHPSRSSDNRGDGSGVESRGASNQNDERPPSPPVRRPPSPPETDLSAERRRSRTSTSHNRDRESPAPDSRPRSRASGISRSDSRNDDKSKLSTKSKASSQATFVKATAFKMPAGVQITAGARSAATSVLPRRSASGKKGRTPSPIDIDDSPESVQDSSPKTPTVTPQFPPPHVFPEEKRFSAPHIRYDDNDRPTPAATPMTDFGPPPPPPPPPPTLSIQEIPRVDYLLQNGGLQHPVSKNFLAVIPPFNGNKPSNPPLAGAERLFAPFFNLLDQYQNVIHKQGSVAVATGHKSVARRLLDRLEDVFSRDLPEEGCNCIMCESTPGEHRGLGWGEVLERVGGRIDLPPWPPFDLANLGVKGHEGATDLPPRPSSPVKLDPDIAEEFREHYLRQSKKVRSAVDKWLNVCSDAPAPPPQEVDDETLTFAILTNLDNEERPYFNALLSGARELQATVRAPTPNVRKPRVDFIVKMGLALQRLYRLPIVPRDAETAMYLIKNPFHHDLLVTISDISLQEWEILTSGRFDGFLWSGADGDEGITPTAENPLSRGPTPANGGFFSPARGTTPANGFFSPPPSRGPSVSGMGYRPTSGFGTSRTTTPFSDVYSRGTTPASFVSLSSSVVPGAPGAHNKQAVSLDEEIEMAALAEVEREIYQGMEALEDAFEKLHHRAEMVRNALRQRNAGLMMSMQARRSGHNIDVLPQNSGNSLGNGYERPYWAASGDDETSESDWGGDDVELAPDDSASNISSSRHRRPKRRKERMTPAPIEEDDEEI